MIHNVTPTIQNIKTSGFDLNFAKLDNSRSTSPFGDQKKSVSSNSTIYQPSKLNKDKGYDA